MLDEIETDEYLIVRISWHHVEPSDFLIFFKAMTRRYLDCPDRWFNVWRVL